MHQSQTDDRKYLQTGKKWFCSYSNRWRWRLNDFIQREKIILIDIQKYPRLS
jgi:hypothetical protein